jgi:MFS family permease
MAPTFDPRRVEAAEGAQTRENSKMKLRAPKTTDWVLIILCVMYLVVYVDRANVGTAAGAIRQEFGLTNVQLGMVFSAFSYPYAAVVLLGGYLADKFGPRLTFFSCCFLFSVATVLTGFAGSLMTLMLARGLVGLGEGPALSTGTRAMTNWMPQTKWGFGQGITHSCARLGTAVAPPIVAALIAAFSWRGSFIVIGLISMAWSIVWYVYFRDVPADHPGITPEELKDLRVVERRQQRIPFRALFIRHIPLIITFFCYGWTLWVYLNWLPSFFLQSYKLNLSSSALFSGGILAGGVIGDTLGGVVSDLIYKRTGSLLWARTGMIVGGFLAAFVCLMGVLVSTDITTVTIALTVAFFFMELSVSSLWMITMDVSPKYSGTAGGLLSLGFALSGVLSPIVFGYVVDLTGDWHLPFAISMGLLIVGAVSAFWLKPHVPFVEPAVPVSPLDGKTVRTG